MGPGSPPTRPASYRMRMSDSELVAAIAARDAAALAVAYDQHAAALHAYSRSLLTDPADAADTVQDTFIIAASKLGELRGARARY